MKKLLLLTFALTSCQSGTITDVRTANAEIRHFGRWSFLRASDYDEENDAIKVNSDGSIEIRNRAKTHGRDEDNVAGTLATGWGTGFSIRETNNGTRILEETKQVGLKEDTKRAAINATPTITTPGEQVVTFPPQQ